MSEAASPQMVEAVARECGLPASGVAAVLELVADGATVPFIARYRKERTGALDEVAVRAILECAERIEQLEARRRTIRSQLQEQGVLTPDLEARLEACGTKAELEDLYLPYKQKRKTKAGIARERGLEPLARWILSQPVGTEPRRKALDFVDPEREIPDTDAAMEGAGDLLVEQIASAAPVRGELRAAMLAHGLIESRRSKKAPEGKTPFDDYLEYEEPVARIAPHRFSALRRGAKEGILDLKVELDRPRTLAFLERRFGLNPSSECAPLLADAAKAAWSQRLRRSLEKEVLQTLEERSDEEAARVFARNLQGLLLSAPLGARPVLGIDPGFRTGCKCAALDATGRYLGGRTIHPHQGKGGAEEAARALRELVARHAPDAIAVGDGTAGREIFAFVREALAGTEHAEVIVTPVSEAGASVYSASEIAREEFPDLDLTVRGAISIARRLQDPLAELVKIDPRSIGVGQYQHDVPPKLLQKRLADVVETSVNAVGVELNTASSSLLTHVAGLGAKAARSIVEHRERHGPFGARRELLKVAGLGPRTFEQAAGFLRIRDGREPLDRSAVHPERYEVVRRMARDAGAEVATLLGDQERVDAIELERYVDGDLGEPTLRDIAQELKRPGRDPRRVFEAPRYRDDVKEIEDLSPGMELEARVTNVTAIGAFCDLGVHRDGLIHRSAFWRRVHDPSELVAVGDRLTVVVEEVDLDRKRIALRAPRAPGAAS